MNVLDLARPEILALKAYASARMEAQGGRILLNANESAYPSFDDCQRYPDPQPAGLVEALAVLYGVEAEWVLVGRGSDEAIDLLLRAFCRAGKDAILINPPTFGMYAVSAHIQHAAVLEVPLDQDFRLDVEAVLAAWTPGVKLVFVCNPNNPTGQLSPLATLERLAEGLANKALLVVDEAYQEFVTEPARSAISLLARYRHVAVLRTLSKAWAMAGARIGCLLADPEVVALLRRIMAPYPLPLPCIRAGLAALTPAGQAQVREQIAACGVLREALATFLAGLPQVREVLPSQANFVAVRFRDAQAAYRSLLAAGIVVRDLSKYPRLADALRITVGSAEENREVVAVLRRLKAAEVSAGELRA